MVYRKLVNDFSSSEQATSKCSRLVMIWAICDNVDVPAKRLRMGSLIWFTSNLSSDYSSHYAASISMMEIYSLSLTIRQYFCGVA